MSAPAEPIKKIALKRKPKKPSKDELLEALPRAIKELSEVIENVEKEVEQIKDLNLKYIPEMIEEALGQLEDEVIGMQEHLEDLQALAEAKKPEETKKV